MNLYLCSMYLYSILYIATTRSTRAEYIIATTRSRRAEYIKTEFVDQLAQTNHQLEGLQGDHSQVELEVRSGVDHVITASGYSPCSCKTLTRG